MGVLGFASLRAERYWDTSMVQRLELLGQVFANALVRKRAEEELYNAFSEIKILKERLEAENIFLREEITLKHHHGEIIGQSNAIKIVLAQAEQVADTDTSVLILGETGTGKELMARALHNLSRRKDRPMITVNCAALPSTLVESELFGHVKGAYTGAQSKRIGRFELANGSTLFLDEVGELSPGLQAKLLRVLQTKQFERLGGQETISTDVRIIARHESGLSAGRGKRRVSYGSLLPSERLPHYNTPPSRATRGYPRNGMVFRETFLRKIGKTHQYYTQEHHAVTATTPMAR